jgi:hypothetical protein
MAFFAASGSSQAIQPDAKGVEEAGRINCRQEPSMSWACAHKGGSSALGGALFGWLDGPPPAHRIDRHLLEWL